MFVFLTLKILHISSKRKNKGIMHYIWSLPQIIWLYDMLSSGRECEREGGREGGLYASIRVISCVGLDIFHGNMVLLLWGKDIWTRWNVCLSKEHAYLQSLCFSGYHSSCNFKQKPYTTFAFIEFSSEINLSIVFEVLVF